MPEASDYIDPTQIGPTPQAVAMPGGPVVNPQTPQPPIPGPSQSDIDKLMKQRGQNTDTLISGITKAGEERTKLLNEPAPRVPVPKYQDIPQPPQDNFQSLLKDKTATAGLIFATVMGSMFSKQHGMGAMAAATGFINAQHDGQKEKMDMERENWNNQVKKVIDQNNIEHERYDAVWNNAQLSMADKQAKIQALAASVGDEQTIAALKNGDMDFAYKLQSDRYNASMKLYEAQQKYGMGGAGAISDAGLHLMVDQYLAGDKSALTNLGRGAQSAQNITRFRNMLAETAEARGITGPMLAEKMASFNAYAAAQRALAQRETNLGVATQELVNFSGPALAASQAVKRGNWVPVNKINQDVQALQSNPDLRELSDRTAGLITAYAQVISRTGVPTVHAQERAADLLNKAESVEAYERGVDTLISEADLAEKAPDQIRQKFKAEFLGTPAPEREQSKSGPSGTTSSGVTWSIQP